MKPGHFVLKVTVNKTDNTEYDLPFKEFDGRHSAAEAADRVVRHIQFFEPDVSSVVMSVVFPEDENDDD